MSFLKKSLAVFLITALLVPGLVVVSEAEGSTGLSYCQFSKGPCKHGSQCPLKGSAGHNHESSESSQHSGHGSHHDNHQEDKVDNQDNLNHMNHTASAVNHNSHNANHNDNTVGLEICHKDDNKAASIIFTIDRDRPLIVASPLVKDLDFDGLSFSPEDKIIYNDHLKEPPVMPPLT